jgi:hypothetical protein
LVTKLQIAGLLGPAIEPLIRDVDNDGKNELLIAVHLRGLAVFKTQGDPATWSYYMIPLPAEVLSTGDRPDTARIYDLDPLENNGNEIVIGGNFSKLAILKHTTGQIYQTLFVSEKLPYFTQYVAAGDVDGDGMLEAIARTTLNTVHIFKKQHGAWGELTRFTQSGPSVYATDLNGDGKAEVVLATGSGPKVFSMDASGTFAEKWQSGFGFSSWIFAK